MTSINEKDAPIGAHCSPSTTAVEASGASELPNLRVDDSASIYLLRKVAYGIPRFANAIWGMIQDIYIVGIVEGMNAEALAEVGVAANAVLSSTPFLPYIQSALRGLASMNDDLGDILSPDTHTQDNDDDIPVASDMSDASSCEQHNVENTEDGLMFPSSDMDKNESDNKRLDYVITQVDVSRMARTASRHLNVESIHQLPTITYRAAKSELICSGHEEEEEAKDEEDVDEFLLRNAQIIEDYISHPEDNFQPKCQKEDPKNEHSQFSYMMVPQDPKEQEIIRMSNSIQSGEASVPDSISICKTDMECNRGLAYQHCVICKKPFKDGESLRVLPCQHLFHCGCIDGWLSSEASDYCIISGCPMCKKEPTKTPPQQEISDECPEEPQGESYHSDGSVPSWAFARLGRLLSGQNNASK